MEPTTIIFDSESKFRDYVTSNLQNINQILVFEDVLEHTVFFYCCLQNHIILASKESVYKSFSSFKKIYKKLAHKSNLYIFHNTDALISIRLNEKEETKQWN